MRLLLLTALCLFVVGCGVSAPRIIYSSESGVTVGHTNMGLRPVLTPAVRNLAEQHCQKYGKNFEYTGIVRDSGFGPEEFDFKCVNAVGTVAEEGGTEAREKIPSSSSGSGFIISQLGYILTNQHVVSKCRTISVGNNKNNQFSARIIETDSINDIALLQFDEVSMEISSLVSLMAKLDDEKYPTIEHGLLRQEKIELGETIMVAGFPYGDMFGDTIKVTGGMVNANRGFGDNVGQFQIDAAVQAGNSGGPIYDEWGNIIGIVFSQLNKISVVQATGSLPENVNYGIKANTINQFLTLAGIQAQPSNRSKQKTTKELALIAKDQTMMVLCNND